MLDEGAILAVAAVLIIVAVSLLYPALAQLIGPSLSA